MTMCRSVLLRVSTLAGLVLAGLCHGPAWSADVAVAERLAGRNALIDVPDRLPAAGARALVVVLHGGGGNAGRIATSRSEAGLNLHAAAAAAGFIVAYLDGSPVTALLGDRVLGWNAGGCCGQSVAKQVDDAGYLVQAVHVLVSRYGIDPRRVYAIGHSNGAMMAQRMVCETDLFAAVVAVSGPLELDVERCPAARGKRVLAIHGADDRNVPVAGGRGPAGLSGDAFRPEADSRRILTESGANYTLWIVDGADHALSHVDEAMVRTHGGSIAQQGVTFFDLATGPR